MISLVVNRLSVHPANGKGENRGVPSTDQEVLWVKIPVGAGSTRVIPKTLKMVVVAACIPLSMKYEP